MKEAAMTTAAVRKKAIPKKAVCKKRSAAKLVPVIAIVALVFAAGHLAAQEGDRFQPQPQQTDFDEKELWKFAKAYVQVQDIQEEFSRALGQANDEKEAKDLQEAYMQKMVNVVRDEGLSVEKYNLIAHALQSDPELREKVSELVGEV